MGVAGRVDFSLPTIAILPEHMHMVIKLDNVNDYPKIIYWCNFEDKNKIADLDFE